MTIYTPAEAAARSGFTIDTLRYYEREGILPAVPRTAGGRRAYGDAELDLLEFLKCLRETGMPVERLRRYGQLCRSDETIPERIALLEEHAESVERQLAEVLAQQQRLAEKLDWYRRHLDEVSCAPPTTPGTPH